MEDIKIGSLIAFGGYDWRVIDIQNKRALVITEEMIGQRSYNNYAGDVTWADCSLRGYLNGEFYSKFTEEEQSRIIPTLIKNHDNQWYGSRGGDDTLDHIFLLSIEEVVCKYFGDSTKYLENRRPKQRYWFQNKDENNKKRVATFDGYIWWWWLRSPGRLNRGAAYIHGDGNVGIQGNGTYRYNSKTIHPITRENFGGVRPALWLSLEL